MTETPDVEVEHPADGTETPESPPIVAWCRICGVGMEEQADYCAACRARYSVEEGMPVIHRESLKDALPSLSDRLATLSPDQATIVRGGTPKGLRVAGSRKPMLDAHVIDMLDPKKGLRPYILERLQEKEIARLLTKPRSLNRADVYASVLREMDRRGKSGGDLPYGLLTDVAEKYQRSTDSIVRCIRWAELTIRHMNITLS